jgi:anaerobic selenocysteine-containing dehydrogenase
MQDLSDISRRDFGKLTLAAMAGMCAGAASTEAADAKKEDVKNPLLSDPHVCRGLNTCKAKGVDKKNTCAGLGQCATAAKHGCGAQNQCKGQGGCGSHPGENACKEQGECSVPLHSSAWKKARARYEELMKAGGKKFGPAPEAKKKPS